MKFYLYLQQGLSLKSDEPDREEELFILSQLFDLEEIKGVKNSRAYHMIHLKRNKIVIGCWEFWEDIKEPGTGRSIDKCGYTIIVNEKEFKEIFGDFDIFYLDEYFNHIKKIIRDKWLKIIFSNWKNGNYRPIEINVEDFYFKIQKKNLEYKINLILQKILNLNVESRKYLDIVLANTLRNEKLLLYNLNNSIKQLILQLLSVFLPSKIRQRLSYLSVKPKLPRNGMSKFELNNLTELFNLYDIVLTNAEDLRTIGSLLYHNRKFLKFGKLLDFDFEILDILLDYLDKSSVKNLDRIYNIFNKYLNTYDFADPVKLLKKCIENREHEPCLETTKSEDDRLFKTLFYIDKIAEINKDKIVPERFIMSVDNMIKDILKFDKSLVDIVDKNPKTFYDNFKNLYNIFCKYIINYIKGIDYNNEVKIILNASDIKSLHIYQIFNLLQKLPDENSKKLYNIIREDYYTQLKRAIEYSSNKFTGKEVGKLIEFFNILRRELI